MCHYGSVTASTITRLEWWPNLCDYFKLLLVLETGPARFTSISLGEGIIEYINHLTTLDKIEGMSAQCLPFNDSSIVEVVRPLVRGLWLWQQWIWPVLYYRLYWGYIVFVLWSDLNTVYSMGLLTGDMNIFALIKLTGEEKTRESRHRRWLKSESSLRILFYARSIKKLCDKIVEISIYISESIYIYTSFERGYMYSHPYRCVYIYMTW